MNKSRGNIFLWSNFSRGKIQGGPKFGDSIFVGVKDFLDSFFLKSCVFMDISIYLFLGSKYFSGIQFFLVKVLKVQCLRLRIF